MGAVRLLSVIIAASLMDKAGRKALLYTSSMLMFLATLTLTMVSHTTPCPPSPTPPNLTTLDYNPHTHIGYTLEASQSSTSLIPLISTMVFIFGKCNLQHCFFISCLLKAYSQPSWFYWRFFPPKMFSTPLLPILAFDLTMVDVICQVSIFPSN